MQQPQIIYNDVDSVFIHIPPNAINTVINPNGSITANIQDTDEGKAFINQITQIENTLLERYIPMNMQFEKVYTPSVTRSFNDDFNGDEERSIAPMRYDEIRIPHMGEIAQLSHHNDFRGIERNLAIEGMVYQSRISHIHWLRSHGVDIPFPEEYQRQIDNIPITQSITFAGRQAIGYVNQLDMDRVITGEQPTPNNTPIPLSDRSIAKIVQHIEKKDLKILCKRFSFKEGSISIMRRNISSLSLKDIPDNIIQSIAKKMNLGIKISNIKQIRRILASKC